MPAAFTFLLFDCGQSGRQIAMQIIKKVLQKFASFKSTATLKKTTMQKE